MSHETPSGRRAAALWIATACALSLLLPACSRKDYPFIATVNQRPTASIGASRASGPAPLHVDFSSAAVDPEGGALTYDWGFGDGGTSTIASPTHIFAADGSYEVELQVTDDHGAIAHDHKVITVGGTNNAPIVNAGFDQVNEDPGNLVDLIGSVVEPDGQGLTYGWTQVGGPAVTLTYPNSLTPSFTSIARTTATYVFRLFASDDAVPPATASDDITVTTRVTYANTTLGLFQVHNTSYGCIKSGCHDGVSEPNWGDYATVVANSTFIVQRLSPGGNMRGYLQAGEPDIIIAWLQNGAPQTNP